MFYIFFGFILFSVSLNGMEFDFSRNTRKKDGIKAPLDLVEDCIEKQNGWKLLDQKILDDEQQYKKETFAFIRNKNVKSSDLCSIRKKESYIPSNASPDDKLIAILTHGTWGKATPSFYHPKTEENQNYRHLKRFVSWYAYANKKAVDLISFRWSGRLSDEARIASAQELNKYIKENYFSGRPLLLVAHSHGCNVHNHFSQLTKNPIELMVHFACPMRHDQPEYRPKNFKQLIYFHSGADIVEPLGRIPEQKLSSLKEVVTEPIKEYCQILPVVVFAYQANKFLFNKILSEPSMSDAWPTFGSMMKGILVGTAVGICRESKERISFKKREILDEKNFFPEQDNSIVIGLNTSINNQRPDHSGVIDVAQYLPEIITKIFREYPAHAVHSFTADLAIKGNGKHTDLSDDCIKLSNLKVSKMFHEIPALVPLIALDAATSSLTSQQEFRELDAKKERDKMFEECRLRNWDEDSIEPRVESADVLVKARDEYGCSVTMVPTLSLYDSYDLAREMQRNRSEKPWNHDEFVFNDPNNNNIYPDKQELD